MPSSFKYCPITFIVFRMFVFYHSTSVVIFYTKCELGDATRGDARRGEARRREAMRRVGTEGRDANGMAR